MKKLVLEKLNNPEKRGFSRKLIREIRGTKAPSDGMMINKSKKGDGRYTGFNSVLGMTDREIISYFRKAFDEDFFSSVKIGSIQKIAEVKAIGFITERTYAIEVTGSLSKLYVEVNLSGGLVRVFRYSKASKNPESGRVAAEVFYAIDDIEELMEEIHKLCLDSIGGTVFREKPKF